MLTALVFNELTMSHGVGGVEKIAMAFLKSPAPVVAPGALRLPRLDPPVVGLGSSAATGKCAWGHC